MSSLYYPSDLKRCIGNRVFRHRKQAKSSYHKIIIIDEVNITNVFHLMKSVTLLVFDNMNQKMFLDEIRNSLLQVSGHLKNQKAIVLYCSGMSQMVHRYSVTVEDNDACCQGCQAYLANTTNLSAGNDTAFLLANKVKTIVEDIFLDGFFFPVSLPPFSLKMQLISLHTDHKDCCPHVSRDFSQQKIGADNLRNMQKHVDDLIETYNFSIKNYCIENELPKINWNKIYLTNTDLKEKQGTIVKKLNAAIREFVQMIYEIECQKELNAIVDCSSDEEISIKQEPTESLAGNATTSSDNDPFPSKSIDSSSTLVDSTSTLEEIFFTAPEPSDLVVEQDKMEDRRPMILDMYPNELIDSNCELIDSTSEDISNTLEKTLLEENHNQEIMKMSRKNIHVIQTMSPILKNTDNTDECLKNCSVLLSRAENNCRPVLNGNHIDVPLLESTLENVSVDSLPVSVQKNTLENISMDSLPVSVQQNTLENISMDSLPVSLQENTIENISEEVLLDHLEDGLDASDLLLPSENELPVEPCSNGDAIVKNSPFVDKNKEVKSIDENCSNNNVFDIEGKSTIACLNNERSNGSVLNQSKSNAPLNLYTPTRKSDAPLNSFTPAQKDINEAVDDILFPDQKIKDEVDLTDKDIKLKENEFISIPPFEPLKPKKAKTMIMRYVLQNLFSCEWLNDWSTYDDFCRDSCTTRGRSSVCHRPFWKLDYFFMMSA